MFHMKKECVFGRSCTVCTAFNIGSCKKRNHFPANSPNLKSLFPEFPRNAQPRPSPETTPLTGPWFGPSVCIVSVPGVVG